MITFHLPADILNTTYKYDLEPASFCDTCIRLYLHIVIECSTFNGWYYLNMGKDIVTIYSTMPPEEALPVIVTTIAVSTLKVGAITGVMLVIK